MTKEEAIKHFEVQAQYGCAPTREAAQMAVAALRARQEPVKLDRSKWVGCELCKDAKNIFSYGVTAFLGQSEDGESELYRDSDEDTTDFDFCPICGRPLTEEAWAELERRIGGNHEAD